MHLIPSLPIRPVAPNPCSMHSQWGWLWDKFTLDVAGKALLCRLAGGEDRLVLRSVPEVVSGRRAVTRATTVPPGLNKQEPGWSHLRLRAGTARPGSESGPVRRGARGEQRELDPRPARARPGPGGRGPGPSSESAVVGAGGEELVGMHSQPIFDPPRVA